MKILQDLIDYIDDNKVNKCIVNGFFLVFPTIIGINNSKIKDDETENYIKCIRLIMNSEKGYKTDIKNKKTRNNADF